MATQRGKSMAGDEEVEGEAGGVEVGFFCVRKIELRVGFADGVFA